MDYRLFVFICFFIGLPGPIGQITAMKETKPFTIGGYPTNNITKRLIKYYLKNTGPTTKESVQEEEKKSDNNNAESENKWGYNGLQFKLEDI